MTRKDFGIVMVVVLIVAMLSPVLLGEPETHINRAQGLSVPGCQTCNDADCTHGCDQAYLWYMPSQPEDYEYMSFQIGDVYVLQAFVGCSEELVGGEWNYCGYFVRVNYYRNGVPECDEGQYGSPTPVPACMYLWKSDLFPRYYCDNS